MTSTTTRAGASPRCMACSAYPRCRPPQPRLQVARGYGRAVTVVIGIDIGTTSTKAGAFDADGRETGRHEVAYPLLEPEPGHAVQDPEAVVAAVVSVTRGAIAAARAA